VLAYAENLRRARAFVASALTTSTGATAERLAGIDEALTKASDDASAHLATMVDADDVAYLASQTTFGIREVVAQEGVFDAIDADGFDEEPRDWEDAIHEDSEILVMEADPAALASDEFLQYAASRMASAPAEARQRYMANVSRHRDERLSRLARATKAQAPAPVTNTDDAPIEALFWN
jgi:hypothetical protein